MAAPELQGDALAAVHHRDGHIQILAAAGSGKTEVVSQRIASLITDGEEPGSIVAFTFTQRAARELKERVAPRVLERAGQVMVDRLGALFTGTINAYCNALLQRYVPRYETYDTLDDNQLANFLAREASFLGLKELDPDGKARLYASIDMFVRNVGVVENELIDPATLDDPFRTVLLSYYEALERYRLLTFGQQVARAIEALRDPAVAAAVHRDLRHLVVDEYQDVNPAQEELIRLLVAGGATLCVVGDDDQAIYQWRGSDVGNIVRFSERYDGVRRFSITRNHRSRPQITHAANTFARTIPGRIEKEMEPFRPEAGGHPAVSVWTAHDEVAETERIASLITDLHANGVPYRDIAILVRGKTAYPQLMRSLEEARIPVQPGGRVGLFEQPEALAIGKVFCWLVDAEWWEQYGGGYALDDREVVDELVDAFALDAKRKAAVKKRLLAWKEQVWLEEKPADLVGELYELLAAIGVSTWDTTDPLVLNRLGTLARLSSLLVDYERIQRRSRPDPDNPGEQLGGEDRGEWYYRSLASHIVNYAQGQFAGFDGEPGFEVDAVDVTTVHRAKGLEWPVVFVASMTNRRFPSSRTGKEQPWLVPRDRFDAERYEGTEADERRLFYVAATRARDWLSVSRHAAIRAKVKPSPYWEELSHLEVDPASISAASIVEASAAGQDESGTIPFAELAAYMECPMAYRLRTRVGFRPSVATEIGYGKAIHSLLREVAEKARATGSVPAEDEIAAAVDRTLYLPLAPKAAHREMKASATRLVQSYAREHADDLQRTWEPERSFALHLDGVTVACRTDVIDLAGEPGGPIELADHVTSGGPDATRALALQVAANAATREGLEVRGAWIHDLGAQRRYEIPTDPPTLAAAEERLLDAAARLRAREFPPNPGPRCAGCDVKVMCPAAER